MILDLQLGTFDRQAAQSVRTVGQLAKLFAEEPNPDSLGEVVYEIHGCPAEVDGPPKLLYATTVLYPGEVDGEYFMTRGHFHTDPSRGELMFTLSGDGGLILMDREGETWMEPMEKGSVHDIDGRHAHRVVNTGSEPLIFLVAWMSDCGHDYQLISERGFGKRVFRTSAGPALR